LSFMRVNATAMTVRLDGITVFEAGDKQEPTANLWNSMFVIPLRNSSDGTIKLELQVSGNQLITMKREPFLMNTGRAFRLASFHRFLFHDLLMFFMGSSVLVGILLIGFPGHQDHKRWDSVLLGVSCILISFYAFDYTERLSTGSMMFYGILKPLMAASGYLGTFTYFASLDYQHHKRFTLSRWMTVPTAAAIILLFSAPTPGVMYSRFIYTNLLPAMNLLWVIYLAFRKLRDRPLYLIATGLIALALIQITIIMIFQTGGFSVMQYVVVIVSVLFGLQYFLDYRELVRDRESLRQVFNRDPLTEAYNRHALFEVNLKHFSSAVFIDFDNFKYFNDKHGHNKGDILLREFVVQAKSVLRKGDLIIRYGGDEFLILLKEIDRDEAFKAAERIRKSFGTAIVDSQVDISYGISNVGPEGLLDIEELDRGMYAMKESKRRES
ncbi:MAG: GGDEF domain-containing protein, partial [Spirochaetaceae bacterium]|nr:GGDEF domain-containing protein [Spirochaetaceae bacterium]